VTVSVSTRVSTPSIAADVTMSALMGSLAIVANAVRVLPG
jgi:hypothetical protein